MKRTSIFNGKNKFSELIADAASGDPHIITKNGKETAVVISIEEYRRLTSDRVPLGEFLRNSALRGSGIDLTRDNSPLRNEFDLEGDD